MREAERAGRRTRLLEGLGRCILFLGMSVLLLPPWAAQAGKTYVWRDREGQIHITDTRPQEEEGRGEVLEREVREGQGAGKPRERPAPRSPIEQAVQCTFRLSNSRGGGSGFFIDGKGLAVTARHVVEDSSYSFRVEMQGDSRKHPVQVLARGKKYDLALLRVLLDEATPFLAQRDPETLVPGEEVWAVGNPLLAFKDTVTKGIFSRLFLEKEWRKELKMKPPYKGNWIQFSAQITGGNSGGPVVDKDGRLVGIVSLGLRNYGAINFAVPASYIQEEFSGLLK